MEILYFRDAWRDCTLGVHGDTVLQGHGETVLQGHGETVLWGAWRHAY